MFKSTKNITTGKSSLDVYLFNAQCKLRGSLYLSLVSVAGLVNHRVTLCSKSTGSQLYTWVERGRQICLLYEHNAMTLVIAQA